MHDYAATEPTSWGVAADRLRQIGDRYHWAAAIVGKLEGDGWSILSWTIFVHAKHSGVRTPAQARQRLSALGIDLKDVKIETNWSPRRARKSLSRRRQSGSPRRK